MISLLAQAMILYSRLPAEPDPKKVTAAEPVYRPYCSECDEEGRDARLPCEGHN